MVHGPEDPALATGGASVIAGSELLETERGDPSSRQLPKCHGAGAPDADHGDIGVERPREASWITLLHPRIPMAA